MVVTVTDTPLLEAARATPLHRRGLTALSRQVAAAPPAEVDAAVDEALARADGDAAAALLLAAAAAGRRCDARRIAPVLPLVLDDLVLEALVAASTGDRVGVLVEAARSGRLDGQASTLALLVATALLDGKPAPPAMIAELRLLARESLDEESADMVATCAKTLRDPHLLALAKPLLASLEQAGEGLFDLVAMRRRVNGPPLAIFPEEEAPRAEAPPEGESLKAAAKVGRNDPCPCGSGKKFKKCCEGKAAPASADTGPAADAPASPGVDDGGGAAPAELPRHKPAALVALDPTTLSPEALRTLYSDLVEYGLWEAAERVVDVLVARTREDPTILAGARAAAADGADQGSAGQADEEDEEGDDAEGEDPEEDDEALTPDAWRLDLIGVALEVRAHDVVRRQLAKLDPAERETPEARLLGELAAPGPLVLERLEAVAALALDGPRAALELATWVSAGQPALGALLARAALDPTRPPATQEWLVELVERARDRLLLAPGDPLAALLEGLRAREKVAADAAAEKARAKAERKRPARARPADEPEADPEVLRERLRAAATRASELEEELRRVTSARAREERRGPRDRGQSTPGDAAEVARLREKVEKLEAILTESQEERRQLRRELEEARARDDEEARRAAAAEPEARRAQEDDAEEGPALEAPDERRPALVPIFSDGAAAAIRDADRALGRSALRIVSGVAGGDPQVWAQVKRLRRRSDLCSARVGIHYRLLFRLHPARGELEVVSFINRRELDATIRRLA
jgi:hypothetical protein